jgi:hypothetical protein
MQTRGKIPRGVDGRYPRPWLLPDGLPVRSFRAGEGGVKVKAKTFLIVAGVAACLDLTLAAVVLYTVFHFIIKFW